MQILCIWSSPRLEFQRGIVLVDRLQTLHAAPSRQTDCGSIIMQDIVWIGLILGLLAASLGYVALCGKA